MLLTRLTQSPLAIRTRLVDYCANLALEERITSVEITVEENTVEAPLTLTYVLNGDFKGFTLTMFGGVAGHQYCVSFLVNTTYQRFDDHMVVDIQGNQC